MRNIPTGPTKREKARHVATMHHRGFTSCCRIDHGFLVQLAGLLLLVQTAHGFVVPKVSEYDFSSNHRRNQNGNNNLGQYGITISTTRTTAAAATSTTTQLAMFDQLSSAITTAIENTIGSASSRGTLTAQRIEPALKSVRRALLDADVNVNVADTLIAGVRERSLGTKAIKGITPNQQFIKAMNDELVDLMGGSSSSSSSNNDPMSTPGRPASTLAIGKPGKPAIVLLAGLQGAGKTTLAGKLALYLKEREIDYTKNKNLNDDATTVPLGLRLPKRNRKVLLVAADTYRPAAVEQLKILGQRIGVPVFVAVDNDNHDSSNTPVQIVQKALLYAKQSREFDTVIIDTAGRQVIDLKLMNELKAIQKIATPDETLLIVDAMTGQEAASLTAVFDSAVGLTGAILTKLDGDSRGGAAVSVRAVSGQPIKFIGTGEQLEDLEPFYPERMASRILGMGDVITLVEKAAADVSEAEAKKMQQKMLDASFDFDDFLKQTEVMSKMGGVLNIAKMMPGMGNQLNLEQVAQVEQRLKRSKAIICSMTRKERANPDLLIKDKTARSRLIRITKGSGTSFEQGQKFISEFQKMKTLMSRMQKQMPQEDNGGAAMADMVPELGNRAMRRAAKKKPKTGRQGGGGFG